MKRLLLFSLILSSLSINAQVAPFLSTTWNQTCYYNALMPTVGTGGSCGKAYTGCNATAIGQIFKYYAYPATGLGNHCNSLAPTECVDYELASYNYAAMPNNVTSTNTDVATLMYDIGVAVDMNWSGTNSTSFFSSSILKKHFAYSPKMYSTATFLFPTTADLIAGIKAEMDAGRPVFAKGGGHFYLIDGYNASDEFHMNFGWGGTYNGYFAINSVVNGAGTFTPSNFIFNIQPMQGDLETAKDTIFISANGVSIEALEFTSLLDWTATPSTGWITPSITSGTKGFYDYSAGSTFAAPVNNGPERIGYIVFENTNSIDSVVIVQASSPLSATPNPIDFVSAGATETVNITYQNGVSWNAAVTVPWLSVTPNTGSGTGTGSFDVICEANSTGSVRSDYVVLTSGVFTDSIAVTQQASLASVSEIAKQKVTLYPNPTNGKVTLSGAELNEITDVLGNRLRPTINFINKETIIDLCSFPNGVYFIKTPNGTFRVVKKD